MSPPAWTPGGYPFTRASNHVDIYQSASNGQIHVSDPYDWMEHPSEEVENWMRDQTAFTQAYLDQFQDNQKLETEFRSILDYPKACLGISIYFNNNNIAFCLVFCTDAAR